MYFCFYYTVMYGICTHKSSDKRIIVFFIPKSVPLYLNNKKAKQKFIITTPIKVGKILFLIFLTPRVYIAYRVIGPIGIQIAI